MCTSYYNNSVKCNDRVSLVRGSGCSPQVLKSYHSEQIKEQGKLLPLSSESVIELDIKKIMTI